MKINNINIKKNPPIKKNQNSQNINKDLIHSSSKMELKINDNLITKKNNNNSDNENKSLNLKNKNDLNDYELNNLSYEEALNIDKRKYLEYLLSLLRTKEVLIFSFYADKDYNSKIIKIILFLFSFALYYFINALFFTDSTIHNIYANDKFVQFIYQIPQIMYSTIISTFCNKILSFLALSEKNIVKLKKEKKDLEKRAIETKKCLLKKIKLFFVLNFLILIFFWYYLGCFCAVYKNTQIHLFKDTVFSFLLSLLYPILICLLPGIFRILSLKAKKRDKKCLYKFSLFLQLI